MFPLNKELTGRMEKRESTCVTTLVFHLDSAQLGEGKKQTLIFHCGYRILLIFPYFKRRKVGAKGLSDSSGGTESLFLPLPLNSSLSEFQSGFSKATFSRM